MEMYKCENCGAQVNPKTSKCEYCGATFVAKNQTTQTEDVTINPTYTPEATVTTNTNSGGGFLKGLGAAIGWGVGSSLFRGRRRAIPPRPAAPRPAARPPISAPRPPAPRPAAPRPPAPRSGSSGGFKSGGGPRSPMGRR